MAPISFPIKLWNIVHSCPNDLMRWSDDGKQVLVNEHRFQEVVDRYPSFLRQPTLWGFHRMFAVYEFRRDQDCEKTGWVRYSHPYFVQGQTDLLELFVLSHQIRRYNTRKMKSDKDDCKRPKKAQQRYSFEEFDIKGDLQPIRSSSQFQLTLTVGLDIDSIPDEQPTWAINQQCSQQTEEYSSANCSTVIEIEPSDVNDSDVSYCVQEVVQGNFETWMSHMNENDEWFGLKDQPIAVPVSCDFKNEDVDHAEPTYVGFLQMQHCSDIHYLPGNMTE